MCWGMCEEARLTSPDVVDLLRTTGSHRPSSIGNWYTVSCVLTVFEMQLFHTAISNVGLRKCQRVSQRTVTGEA